MGSSPSFEIAFRSITWVKLNSIHDDRDLHAHVSVLDHLDHDHDGIGGHVDEVATSIISKTTIYYLC